MFLLRFLLAGFLVVYGTSLHAMGVDGEVQTDGVTVKVAPTSPSPGDDEFVVSAFSSPKLVNGKAIFIQMPEHEGEESTSDGEESENYRLSIDSSSESDENEGKKNVLRFPPESFKTPEKPVRSRAPILMERSPVTQAARDLSPLRHVCLEHYDEFGRRKPVSLLEFREELNTHLPNYPSVELENETVFLTPGLFRFEQKFLTKVGKKYKWVSNRDRMKEGLAPICYKAYMKACDRAEVDLNNRYAVEKVLASQARWYVECHHLDKRMHGFGILLMVPGLHRGGEWGYYVDFSQKKPQLLQKHISSQQRDSFKRRGSVCLVNDVLHPLFEEDARHSSDGNVSYPSRINRIVFDEQRQGIWKAIGEGRIKITELPSPVDVLDDPTTAPKKRATAKRIYKDENSESRASLRFTKSDYNLRRKYHRREAFSPPPLNNRSVLGVRRLNGSDDEFDLSLAKRQKTSIKGDTQEKTKVLFRSPPTSPYKPPRLTGEGVLRNISNIPLFSLEADGVME